MPLDNYEDYNLYVTELLVATATKSAIDIQLFINQLKIAGATDETIKALLLLDLEDRGRLFGTLTNNVVRNVKSNINIISNVASMNTYEKAGVQEFQWIVVSGDNACKDCKPRQGKRGTMQDWYDIGTPASGWSVCREHCKCRLEPIDYDGKTEFIKPKIK